MQAPSASGTASRNTLRQPKRSISTPPSGGPMAKASPLQLAQTPSARRRAAASGHTTRTIASEAGSSNAAPTPAKARAAISTRTSGASAHPTEAAAIIAAPATKASRRPYRSAISPPLSSSTA